MLLEQPIPLVLMTTAGCSLCEKAIEVMAHVIDLNDPNADIQVFEQDIAESEAWVEAYGTRIPVVVDEESKEEISWPFDEPAFAEFVSRVIDHAFTGK